MSQNHNFIAPQSSDSRSPCPALNALANHGHLPHNGKDFTFLQLIKALVLVYNISYTLAFILATAGFMSSGKLSIHSRHGLLDTYIPRRPALTLDLNSLSKREGFMKIAHDGSLVHPDGRPSTCPDPIRAQRLLQLASSACDSKGDPKGGLDFGDIARIRTENVRAASPKLGATHEQVSLGECGLMWEVFQDAEGRVIPTDTLRQWLVGEQLPEGWESRPKRTVGLLQAKKAADEMARLTKKISAELRN
ncbi:Cloroperoxidase [Phlegmacium glaucopus]|nr:Cloroperoxidase [Phlegmacium glaucopus]